MLFSLKILHSDWSDLFFHTPMNTIVFFDRPSSLWLAMRAVVHSYKTNECKVYIFFNKNSTTLNKIHYTQIFVIYYKKVVGLLIIGIDINIFGFYCAIQEQKDY